MAGFARTLQSYRSGALSREELFAEIDRQLTGEADIAGLLTILNEEQSRVRLPGNLHAEIARKLLQWREIPASGGAQAQARAPEGPARDETPTISIENARAARQAGHTEHAAPQVVPYHATHVSLGTVLQGRFRLTQSLGKGGMSTVYKAIDLRKVEAQSAEPHVAVKLMSVPLGDFTQSLAMLQSEAHKLQTLPHPNIVRVIDCDRDGTTVFMTMEYLRGEPLKRKLGIPDFQGLPPQEAIHIVQSIASALGFAHRNGIVHGDLKPGNVFLTDQGEIKVIDFGIARLMARAHDKGNTQQRLELNALTPPYASPEMLEGGDPDPRDDIYALACITHELLTGRHPFDHVEADIARDNGLRPVRQLPLSRTQFKAIARGLEFDRQKRTPTAEQFVEELCAKPRMKGGMIAAALAVVLLGLLAAEYLLDHGHFIRWVASERVKSPAPVPGQVFRDCPTCPLMKALPAGRFEQGAAADQADATPFEQPEHLVALPRPFGIGVYEITVGEFREFVYATSRKSAECAAYDGTWQARSDLSWNNPGYPQTATHPVTCVSWRDAHDYARWLSQKTHQRYRLASEAEWEYAARAGSGDARPWGTHAQAACASANVADAAAAQRYPGWKVQPCNDGYVYSAPVGSFEPNSFGLYDMLGNVFEWVQDCWHTDYRQAPANGSAWLNGDCTQHVLRGGSWFTAPALVSVSARNRFEESYRSNSIGFRLAREIP
jgi:formylglycine-generating enzyme required for sulfatase activity